VAVYCDTQTSTHGPNADIVNETLRSSPVTIGDTDLVRRVRGLGCNKCPGLTLARCTFDGNRRAPWLGVGSSAGCGCGCGRHAWRRRARHSARASSASISPQVHKTQRRRCLRWRHGMRADRSRRQPRRRRAGVRRCRLAILHRFGHDGREFLTPQTADDVACARMLLPRHCANTGNTSSPTACPKRSLIDLK